MYKMCVVTLVNNFFNQKTCVRQEGEEASEATSVVVQQTLAANLSTWRGFPCRGVEDPLVFSYRVNKLFKKTSRTAPGHVVLVRLVILEM